tara:strand:- start:52130 stop:52828 length:699 start_codon:yes stop_codon:yes gene_type:complete
MNSKKDYSTTTAILLFAQSENIESALKPIASNCKQNILLWKKMNDRVLKTIQKTNLSYFVSNENNQIGNTFGEKITHSIREIFDKGFEKVIVVGNDCIELKTQYLLEAERDLEFNDLVIGSDNNGGAYLIGVTKSKFIASQFETIPWQTKNVFSALQTLYKTQSIAYLPCLNDCNSTSDFKKAIHKLSFSNPLRSLLLSLLQNKTLINQNENTFFSYKYGALNFNKGSPFSF